MSRRGRGQDQREASGASTPNRPSALYTSASQNVFLGAAWAAYPWGELPLSKLFRNTFLSSLVFCVLLVPNRIFHVLSFFLLSEDKFYDREFFPEESNHRAKQQFWGVCVGKPGHISSDELVTSCLGPAVRCVI